MWMAWMGLLLLFASVTLMVAASAPDYAQQAIRARLLMEVGVLDTKKKNWLAKWLDKFEPINNVLPVAWLGARVGGNLSSGHVNLTTLEFLTLKEFMAIGFFVTYMVFATFNGGAPNPVFMVLMPVLGFLLPDVWLKRRIQARREAIVCELPEVVDLLHLCVQAGVDFMGGLTRVVREFHKGPLHDELTTVLHEIRMGKQRREALRALGKRVNVPDIASFVRAMVQADRMGTGIGEALQILSEETRLRRYHRAERFAQKAPIKMLFPLMMIMLTVLIVVGGPIMLQFLHGDLLPKRM